jgi:hypothetical protein
LKTDIANQENLAKLATVKQWFERTLSVIDNDYANRIKQLRLIFNDLLTVDILDEACELREQQMVERSGSQGAADEDADAANAARPASENNADSSTA